MRTIPGLERIKEYDEVFKGKAIGLITNFSGITSDWKKDNLMLFREQGYHIARIFTPEHGLNGAGAGEAIDEKSQQREGEAYIVSLYGEKKKPDPQDLQGIDLLVFDMQDAGLRYYTYLYTMTYAMEAAGEAGIPFVVLDRPNPLGGSIITGARILPSLHSFVGDYELPMRHGLTLGEAAGYFKEYAGLKLDLKVIRMDNYTSRMMYPQTGLLWNIPSPALPAFENTLCYSGGCLFEACNISEGRGSMKPFLMYGAPFLDMDLVYRDLWEQRTGEGYVFRRRAFIPVSGKYAGEVCYGLEFHPLSPEEDFLPTALTLMKIICDRYPGKVVFRKEETFGGKPSDSLLGQYHQDVRVKRGDKDENTVHLKVLYGNDMAEEYLEGKVTLKDLQESWKEDGAAFAKSVEGIRLYD